MVSVCWGCKKQIRGQAYKIVEDEIEDNLMHKRCAEKYAIRLMVVKA